MERDEEQIITEDGIDRRGFLKCMAWAGTGLLWTINGGVPTSRAFAKDVPAVAGGDFSFVQISDSHIGFGKAVNPNVLATLDEAINRINSLQPAPELLLHS